MHTCTQTHTHCLEVSVYFRTFSSFVLLSLLSVKDILMSAVLDSDIPALTFISADKKESRSDSTKSHYMKASEMTAA